MNTSTATSSCTRTESIFARMAQAFLAGVCRAFERTGRANLNGSMPV